MRRNSDCSTDRPKIEIHIDDVFFDLRTGDDKVFMVSIVRTSKNITIDGMVIIVSTVRKNSSATSKNTIADKTAVVVPIIQKSKNTITEK